jgi:hypothetical protein
MWSEKLEHRFKRIVACLSLQQGMAQCVLDIEHADTVSFDL